MDENGIMSDSAREFYEMARDSYMITFRGDSIGENFLCVYFQYSPCLAGAAPGFVYPAPMVFDLRTGDRVYFDDIAADKEGLLNAINETAKQLVVMNDNGISADKYGETIDNFDEYFNYDFWQAGEDKDGERRLVSEDMLQERFTVRDGCFGFYYTLHDFGVGHSDSEGYFAGITFDDAMQYFTDGGKEIFTGYVSAESEPAKVIEYKGDRYFDNAEQIPHGVVDKENMTEGDREFILMFENASNADYYLG